MTTDTASAPASAVEDFLNRPLTLGQRLQHLLHKQPALSPAIVLVLSCVIFSLLSSKFYALTNISFILQQVAVVGALAVGQTLIILTAGVDLSIGAVVVLSSVVMAKLALNNGVPGLIALLIGAAVALGCQFLNGILVTRVKLPPFIVTLGTLSIFTALTLVYAKGNTFTLSSSFLLWTQDTVSLGNLQITAGVFLMLGLYVAFGFALRYTAWGRHVYAVGGDAEAASLAGIQTNRVLLSVYLAAGIAIAVAAWILVGRVGGGDPNSVTNANLQSITAVVIGGTSLFGGRGVVLGSLIGALIVQVFINGLALLPNVDQNYQVFAVGVLVIAAVSVDQWIRSVKA
jgi:fructose transport system permease protein